MPKYLVTRPDLSTFELLTPTKHACERLAERKILKSWTDVVAAFGVWKLTYCCQLTGHEVIFRTPDAVQRIQDTIGVRVDRNDLVSLRDLVVVVDPNGRTLITAFHGND